MVTPDRNPTEACARFRSEVDALLDGSAGSLAPELAEHGSACVSCAGALARRASLRRVFEAVPRVAAPPALDRAVATPGDAAEFVRLELRHVGRLLAPAELDDRVRDGISRPRRFVLIARRRVQLRMATAAAALAAVGITAFRGAGGIPGAGARDPLESPRFVLEHRSLAEVSPYWKSAVEVLAGGAPRDL